jgi:hypothetical protein
VQSHGERTSSGVTPKLYGMDKLLVKTEAVTLGENTNSWVVQRLKLKQIPVRHEKINDLALEIQTNS